MARTLSFVASPTWSIAAAATSSPSLTCHWRIAKSGTISSAFERCRQDHQIHPIIVSQYRREKRHDAKSNHVRQYNPWMRRFPFLALVQVFRPLLVSDRVRDNAAATDMNSD